MTRAAVGTRARPRDEAGAGTLLGLLLAGVLVVVAVTAAALVSVVAVHRTAQAGADLAALAGAATAQDGGDPCREAARIAALNRTRLQECAVRGFEVRVRVVARTAELPVGRLDLPARARAGPVSALGLPALAP